MIYFYVLNLFIDLHCIWLIRFFIIIISHIILKHLFQIMNLAAEFHFYVVFIFLKLEENRTLSEPELSVLHVPWAI